METRLQRRNEIDKQIQRLYQERMKLNETPGTAENSGNLREMLVGAIENTEKTFPEYATVACQEAAAKKLFQYPGILYFKNFDNIFSAIESGLCEYGILPI